MQKNLLTTKIFVMKKSGRKVDLSGISIDEIELWMQNCKQSESVLKCQVILALSRNAKMQEVCNVMGVTRESVRLWKEQLRKGGLPEMLKKGKVGKRSKLTSSKLKELKNIIKRTPKDYELNGNKWTGVLVQKIVSKKWNMKISIRTAYLWLNRAKSKSA